VIAVGAATAAVLGVPLLIALLFAVMAMPTDPVSVLALFEEISAPERLSVLVEGESLLNDGVAVVLFTTTASRSSCSRRCWRSSARARPSRS
jgi:CPA1 family monovalent cation:H+ antiporter